MPVYLRGLHFFIEQGHKRVSSRKLAESVNIKPAQLRKDLSYFGDFGTPGVGYDTKKLAEQIRSVIHLDIPHKAALVGCGNLGQALIKYTGFEGFGLKITALFDKDRRKIGHLVHNHKVEDIRKISTLHKRGIFLAILAVPFCAAQEVAEQLIRAGVQGILNFAPCQLRVPRNTKVINIDIALDFARLPYYLPKNIGASE